MLNTLARTSIVIAVSLVLGATVFREPVALAAKAAQDVFVTNTTADPVPVAPQARPFQVAYAAASADSSACQSVTLEDGKPFELQSIALRRTTGNPPLNVVLRVVQRTSAFSTLTTPQYAFDMSSGFADKLLRLHVRPNPFASAADGDIIALSFCWSNPNAPFTNGVSGYLSGVFE